jgi:hypothetical protein
VELNICCRQKHLKYRGLKNTTTRPSEATRFCDLASGYSQYKFTLIELKRQFSVCQDKTTKYRNVLVCFILKVLVFSVLGEKNYPKQACNIYVKKYVLESNPFLLSIFCFICSIYGIQVDFVNKMLFYKKNHSMGSYPALSFKNTFKTFLYLTLKIIII